MTTTRKKTTVYLDPDLLRSVKVLAASTGRHDYEILEDALRQYLGSAGLNRSHQALRDLLDQLAEQPSPTDEEALELAYAEIHAARRARRY